MVTRHIYVQNCMNCILYLYNSMAIFTKYIYVNHIKDSTKMLLNLSRQFVFFYIVNINVFLAIYFQNLDALHDHLGTLYPGMRAPSFRCTENDGMLILHYYSERPGLEHIVIGIVKVCWNFFLLSIFIKIHVLIY